MALTISQALRRIKKIKGQLAEQQQRAVASVTHLAEQSPAFVFSVCLEQIDSLRAELIVLKTDVARANASAAIEWDGKKISLAFAVRSLEEIRSEIAWLKTLPVKAQTTSEEEHDYMADNKVRVKKYRCHLPEAKRAERAAVLQDRFDALNDVVETMNHKTEV